VLFVVSTAVQRERGPRKNKGRWGLRGVTSRRGDVSTRSPPVGESAVGCSIARLRRAGAGGVSPGGMDWQCGAFTAVGLTTRNTLADRVVNSNSSSRRMTSSALDAISQCEYPFVF